MKFNYEHLDLTPKIHEFIKRIYKLTLSFPDDEKFGITSQVRRSASSILLNVAEGSARNSKAEFARFLTIAVGSLVETDATLKLAVSLNYISDEQRSALDPLIQEIFYKMIALRKSQQTNIFNK